jgi:Transposase DDE domain group 1
MVEISLSGSGEGPGASQRPGLLDNVLRPALSSATRPKTHYRGEVPTTRTPSFAMDAFAHNEVILLINALAYNVAHVARTMVEDATHEGWSLQRVRERVLRVACRVLVHGRRVVLVINHVAASLWSTLWSRLRLLRPADS